MREKCEVNTGQEKLIDNDLKKMSTSSKKKSPISNSLQKAAS